MTRNLIQYPIQTSEIVELLTNYLNQEMKDMDDNEVYGDLSVVILQEAINRIKNDSSWSVRRTDDNGQIFVVRDGMSKSDALNLKTLLENRGHKQVYVCVKAPIIHDDSSDE